MPEHARTPVTIVGLGAMGAALASAYVAAGHPTTVWNRSPEKAAPLVAQGAVHFLDVRDAIAASPLTIACLTTYEATLAALEPAAAALAGRTLVTVNSGIPSGARAMADWATRHGARFLDGAIKNVPATVGAADTLHYYSGDRALFDEYEATLRVIGGDTVHLGTEPDLAALYESAVGGTLLPALLGFFQGAALVTARGLEAGTMVPYTQKWLAMISSMLPHYAAEIDRGDFGEPQSAVGIFHAGMPAETQVAAEAGLDTRWHEPMHALLERAVAEGRADQSIAALVEVLRAPARDAVV
ncbi:NAD(P)-dependent oxidoreductase [Streptomyces flavofungini]|uniref:NAD(P)-dependent oxidoreductase n=1 Tax=Streptomyces flavofungini TaxID=68200 RepID=A0ABS0XEQ6_9ACTN|nr:NAD(P)-binding domain-containing protein [Streptomyces flavofungini]MBJ3811471.1 NAD(P)-dependent oxidoreductase [Streptomyces flavofungini]GHC45076.1 dehydrogenase [Streptomyces flavofungini]